MSLQTLSLKKFSKQQLLDLLINQLQIVEVNGQQTQDRLRLQTRSKAELIELITQIFERLVQAVNYVKREHYFSATISGNVQEATIERNQYLTLLEWDMLTEPVGTNGWFTFDINVRSADKTQQETVTIEMPLTEWVRNVDLLELPYQMILNVSLLIGYAYISDAQLQVETAPPTPKLGEVLDIIYSVGQQLVAQYQQQQGEGEQPEYEAPWKGLWQSADPKTPNQYHVYMNLEERAQEEEMNEQQVEENSEADELMGDNLD